MTTASGLIVAHLSLSPDMDAPKRRFREIRFVRVVLYSFGISFGMPCNQCSIKWIRKRIHHVLERSE